MTEPRPVTPWGLVFILFGAGILAACQVGKAPPVLSDIRQDLGIDLFHAGWILSIFNFTGLMLGTFTGIIADTIGHRRLLMTGFFLLVAGGFFGSFSDSFAMLVCARFFEGTGFLSVIISIPSLIFQIVRPNDIKIALSIWSCYLPAGAALMMLGVPLILKITNWQGLWQINAVILLIYGLLLRRFTISLGPAHQPGRSIRPKQMLRDVARTYTSPGPVLLALIFIVYAMQWLAVMGFLPTLLIEKFHFSKSMASILTAGMVSINILGNLAGGRLLNRGIRRWKLIVGASLVQGCCAFLIYSDLPGFGFNYAGCLIFSIVGGLIPASVLGGVPLFAPSKELVGTTNGIAIQGGQTGQVLGPPILAFLVSSTHDWFSAVWLLSAAAALGIVFGLLLSRVPHTTDRS